MDNGSEAGNFADIVYVAVSHAAARCAHRSLVCGVARQVLVCATNGLEDFLEIRALVAVCAYACAGDSG
jgi:hypothetical protein